MKTYDCGISRIAASFADVELAVQDFVQGVRMSNVTFLRGSEATRKLTSTAEKPQLRDMGDYILYPIPNCCKRRWEDVSAPTSHVIRASLGNKKALRIKCILCEFLAPQSGMYQRPLGQWSQFDQILTQGFILNTLLNFQSFLGSVGCREAFLEAEPQQRSSGQQMQPNIPGVQFSSMSIQP